MQQRRRKVASGVTPSPTLESNLEITPEPGADRWDGDPDEEPVAVKEVEELPAPATKDRFPIAWGLVISDVYHLDVHKTYAKLEKELSLGDGATEYGTVLRAIDGSSKNLYLAARLARKAKNEDERFAMELDKRLEVLRSTAIGFLETDRKEGTRSKGATLKDIEDRMLAEWPDEMSSIKARKAEMHGAFRSIEALESAWRERCQSLRTIALQFKHAGA